MKGFIIVVFVLLFAVSCASVQTAKMPTEDLQETVKAYWEVRKAKDLNSSWNFERRSLIKEPDRRAIFKSAYLQKETAFVVKDFEILEMGKEGSHPKGFTPVRIKVYTYYPANLPVKMPSRERVIELDDLWERIDGRWYRVHVTVIGEFY